MKYKIEIHSVGYDDYCKIVNVASLREAKRFEREAKVEWCEANAIDLDSSFDLPFTRTTKLTGL